MNRKMVFSVIGYIIGAEAILLLFPALVGLIYLEIYALWYLLAAAISAVIGGGLIWLCRGADKTIYAREGFAIVALGWILMSAIGALPFVFTGEIPNYIDAFFETASGFTTTGATILKTVEQLSHATMFWRCFTHWIGGMGVLIFIMAVIPNISDRSVHIMKAEMPGPVFGKLVPRARDTAKILYLIYIGLTLMMFVSLLFCGMPVFDSLVHALGTAGTGGFGIKNDSVAGYSASAQIVITVFMMLFGVNFNLYYLVLVKKFKAALSSCEFWIFLAIFAVSSATLTLSILPTTTISEGIRRSCFQVASIMSSTGFATVDINSWPMIGKGVILTLMLIGGCAGSTAGGLKLSRVIILFRTLKRELRRLVHPRSISTVNFEGRPVDESTVSGIGSYFAVYWFCIIGTFILLCFDPVMTIQENISAAISCFNNIGPGFGMIGGSMADYSLFSKIILSFAMLAGRLEIYPLLLTLLPSTWARHK